MIIEVTEEESRGKECCKVALFNPNVGIINHEIFCSGSKCMKWVWSDVIPKGGCTCDLEPVQKPDACSIDLGDPEDCVFSYMGKDKCGYWKEELRKGHCGLIK